MEAVMRSLTAGSSPLPYAVSTQPGASTLTRMWGATELASARLNEYTPPFAAHNSSAYAPFMPPPTTTSHALSRHTPPVQLSARTITTPSQPQLAVPRSTTEAG